MLCLRWLCFVTPVYEKAYIGTGECTRAPISCNVKRVGFTATDSGWASSAPLQAVKPHKDMKTGSTSKIVLNYEKLPAGESSECRSPRDGQGLSIDGMSDITDNESLQEERPGSGGGEAAEVVGQGIALVVDKEVTSYLMMGALSPGLKRHAVTLFEGRFYAHHQS